MKTIEQLTEAWKNAKTAERIANEERLAIEKQIVDMFGDKIKEKGTTNFPTGLKVVTGYIEKWDQEAVLDIKRTWNTFLPFPFKEEYKPVKAAMDFLEENDKSCYKYLQTALTLSPSKPSFSYKDKE